VDAYRRVQVYFTKVGDARFLSHLDVVRTMDRALRRSGLPIRFTQGMNPKVKMSFPTALPLGMESLLETVEIRVTPSVRLSEIVERLGGALPEGLEPFDADELFTGEKWRVGEILYDVYPGEGGLPSPEDVQRLLDRDAIPVERRGKEIDLRPLITEASLGQEGLRLAIAWTDSGTARPADVLRAMGGDPDARVVKVGVTFRTSFGETIRKTNGPEDPHKRR
jgi:radical SAM-linked protein